MKWEEWPTRRNRDAVKYITEGFSPAVFFLLWKIDGAGIRLVRTWTKWMVYRKKDPKLRNTMYDVGDCAVLWAFLHVIIHMANNYNIITLQTLVLRSNIVWLLYFPSHRGRFHSRCLPQMLKLSTQLEGSKQHGLPAGEWPSIGIRGTLL